LPANFFRHSAKPLPSAALDKVPESSSAGCWSGRPGSRYSFITCDMTCNQICAKISIHVNIYEL
jgi:hypothetical protein